MKRKPYFKDMIYAYLECAMWSSSDESDESGGNPIDQNYSFEDFSFSALKRAVKDCNDFLEQTSEIEYTEDIEQCGHDFWLTRCGHGAGFWDRDLGKIGDQMTAVCKSFGECWLYVGDDNKLYFM